MKSYQSTIKSLKNRKEERLKKEKEKQDDLILSLSEIVNEFPENLKEFLTNRLGSIVVTPQDSFVCYFQGAIPKYDEKVFKIKFVELFKNSEGKILKMLHHKKGDDGNAINKFWYEFEGLFFEVPNSYKKKKPSRIKNAFKSITAFFRIARLIRMIIPFCP